MSASLHRSYTCNDSPSEGLHKQVMQARKHRSSLFFVVKMGTWPNTFKSTQQYQQERPVDVELSKAACLPLHELYFGLPATFGNLLVSVVPFYTHIQQCHIHSISGPLIAKNRGIILQYSIGIATVYFI